MTNLVYYGSVDYRHLPENSVHCYFANKGS